MCPPHCADLHAGKDPIMVTLNNKGYSYGWVRASCTDAGGGRSGTGPLVLTKLSLGRQAQAGRFHLIYP